MRDRVNKRLLLAATAMACVLGSATAPAAADPVDSLIRTLASSRDYKQRLVAAIGLARYKDTRAVPALIAALHDDNAAVLGVAADVLGELGAPQARPALEALLQRSTDAFVRGLSVCALSRLPLSVRPAAPERRHDPLKEMIVKGVNGTLDSDAVQSGIEARFKTVMACVNSRVAALPALGGTLSFKFRVTADGRVRRVQLLASDLGSLSAERCILDVLRTAKFERPDGGEAEFSIPMSFKGTAPFDVLNPSQRKVAEALRAACKQLLAAGEAGAAPLTVPAGTRLTFYLDERGAVRSAGLAAGGAEIPGEVADRLVANATAMILPVKPPAARFAKLSFTFSCSAP